MVSVITVLVIRAMIAFGSGLEARFPSRSAAEHTPGA
jgi:hypothetical protein